MHNRVAPSLADALGNGLGYAAVLLLVAAARELLGHGTLFDVQLLPLNEAEGGWYRPNQMMRFAPSAFFMIGLIIWGVRSWRAEQAETAAYPPASASYREG